MIVILTENEFKSLIEKSVLTKEEEWLLEPYRVRRAVFFAAGRGERLRPITLNTPKPLVRVQGIRIIDRLIDACLNVGIEEIYVVRGYLSEEFEPLKKKYPMIRFIENPYDGANNISSAIVSSHLLRNAFVFESDLLLLNPSIIKKYHYSSEVLGIWKHETDDWNLTVDEEGNIDEEFSSNGKDCYQMVGIYYFNAEDGARLPTHLKNVFESAPSGKDRYWETVPNQVYRGEYKIRVIPCLDSDITEIDSLSELQKLDSAYEITYQKGG